MPTTSVYSPLLTLGLTTALLSGHAGAEDLLVAMHGTGKVERYDSTTGEWVGTFASGLEAPNAVAYGPDGNLYVACGALGGPGTVQRLNGATGAYGDDFVGYPPGENGAIARATDLKFHNGSLYVASCDNGKVIRYDALTGQWISDFTSGSVGGITEIEIHEGRLYWADFHTASIRRCDLATGRDEGAYTTRAGFCPWGIAFGRAGDLFWSGSDHAILQFDGVSNTTWAGPGGPLNTPIHLECDAQGRLFCSSWVANNITVWAGDRPQTLLLTIKGEEVQGPMGMTFTNASRASRPAPIKRLGSWFRLKDQSVHRIGGKSVVRLEARTDSPSVEVLSWDTEGGNRARLNLLRAPLKLRLLLDGRWRVATTMPTKVDSGGEDSIGYWLAVAPNAGLAWQIGVTSGGGIDMAFSASGELPPSLKAVELVFPFNPRATATTLISDDWTEEDEARLPAIISAPDVGQMYVTCRRHPRLVVALEGSRTAGTVTMTARLPLPDAEGYTLSLRPLRLPLPPGMTDERRWLMARRGWFNLIQLSAKRPAEGGRPPHPGGVWANNVISDPVSSVLYMLADHTTLVPRLAPGVSMPPVLRRTVDYWMDHKTDDEGKVAYVAAGGGEMMDSSPAVVIGACSYVEATEDTDWLARRIERIELLAQYTARRDVDNDGLVESKQSGNRGTHAFGDTAWDTYSSGCENAYVNALAYRAFRGLARLEARLGHAEQRDDYDRRAARIKAAFYDTFYNPGSGWLGWWRSEDGLLHDVDSDVPTSLAVMYGLVGTDQGRRMLDAYWAALQASGFKRFDLGVPLNIRPVPRDDQFGEWGGQKEDGSETFGKYLNGGCCVSNAYYFLTANTIVGATDRADMILDAMLERQEKGVFPNGGGFQNGFVDRYPDGAEFMDWQGNTCGYEGHLVYSWAFLQSLLLREQVLRDRVFGMLR